MKLWKPFADAFDAQHLTLFETDHWTVLVKKGQVTLGSLVLAANRNFISAGDLNDQEVLEFPLVVARLEAALSNAFKFDKINYLCLMMVDEHYHFHVIPRYSGERRFGSSTWTDKDWPKPPNLAAPDTPGETLSQLREFLSGHLPGA